MQDVESLYSNAHHDWAAERHPTFLRETSTSIIASTSPFAVVRTWKTSIPGSEVCPKSLFTTRCSLPTRPAAEPKCTLRCFRHPFFCPDPFSNSRCSTGVIKEQLDAPC